jgi:hypothetical protein
MLEAIYATAAKAVIGTLLSFIGVHTPDRTTELTWEEVKSNIPHMVVDGDPNARIMVATDRLINAYGPQAECDQWCLNVALAEDAYARGERMEVLRLAADAYGVPGIEAHMASTIRCESGWYELANNGWHKGLGQQDPRFWDNRAAGAGFPGYSIYDPIAQIFTMAHMVAYRGWGDWACA